MPKKSLQKSSLAEKWIVNASPVIALARVGHTELLTLLPKQAILPQAVVEEWLDAPKGDPARQAVQSGRFKIVKTPAPPEILAWDLGKGETAVLTYARAHPRYTAILDDGAARRCARSLSLTIKGTLAVIILAKQNGLIESASQILYALQRAEFRLDDDMIRDVLMRTVAEEWKPDHEG